MSNENIETDKRFRQMENLRNFPSRSDNIRAVTKRLVYLFEKLEQVKKTTVKPPYFQDDEINALFWLIAHLSITTNYDPRPQMLKVKGAEVIDMKRFEEILKSVVVMLKATGRTEQE